MKRFLYPIWERSSLFQLHPPFSKGETNPQLVFALGNFVSLSLIIALGLFSLGCVTKPEPIKLRPEFNFSKIHRVAVLRFEGTGGDLVANEFVRQLLSAGLEVSDQNKRVEAVLSGSVTDYKPSNKLLVFLGNASTINAAGQTVPVTNPIVSLSGSQVTAEAAVAGLPSAQVVSVQATIGVTARLTDPASGNVVWTDEFNYEGLDAPSTLQAVVNSLAKSLRRLLTHGVGLPS